MRGKVNRIDKKFKELKERKQKALVVFITAGYPDLKITERLVIGFEKAGVDMVELGVPFSDPMADGPVIQHASCQSLKKNTRLIDIINLVKRLRRKVKIPVLLMTYYNTVFTLGDKKFIEKSKGSGVDGVIIPDLPADEGKEFSLNAARAGLHNICFVSPTTSLKRLKLILKPAKGFVYYVSLTGVTGIRKSLPAATKNNVAMIKRVTSLPVCVGFGVSGRAQVKKLADFSDGVIIGSAIVAKIKDNIGNPYLVERVVRFVRGLKQR